MLHSILNEYEGKYSKTHNRNHSQLQKELTPNQKKKHTLSPQKNQTRIKTLEDTSSYLKNYFVSIDTNIQQQTKKKQSYPNPIYEHFPSITPSTKQYRQYNYLDSLDYRFSTPQKQKPILPNKTISVEKDDKYRKKNKSTHVEQHRRLKSDLQTYKLDIPKLQIHQNDDFRSLQQKIASIKQKQQSEQDKTQFRKINEKINQTSHQQVLKYFDNINSIQEALITLLFKFDNVKQLRQYFCLISVDNINLIIDEINYQHIKANIRKSIILEWTALTINVMIKTQLITRRVYIEQMKFMKLIQANHLLLNYKLLDYFIYEKGMNNFKPLYESITKKIQNFFQLNQSISNDLNQVNTLLHYVSESIIIMNLQDKELQRKMRSFLDIQSERSLNDQLSAIKEFIPIIEDFTQIQQSRLSPPKKNDKTQITHLLPPPTKEYTLVLDLDETLIHYVEQNGTKHIFVRPYLEFFLEEMSKNYELIVFTAGLQNYANWVLDQIDPNGLIKHRLYRHHTTFCQNEQAYLKDLNKLGRNLQKTIIIDNTPQNFKKHQENGIQIKTWISDKNDCALKDLADALNIVIEQKGDVRVQLRKLKNKMKNNYSFIFP